MLISVRQASTSASSTTGALFSFYKAALIDLPNSASTIMTRKYIKNNNDI